MGCASSKQSQRRCKHGSRSPVARSYSTHVHYPPEKKGDSYHVVALTSSTLGSLKVDSSPNGSCLVDREGVKGVCRSPNRSDDENAERRKEFELGMIEAKAWAKMIDEKINKVAPKTPTMTPPGEPETINAWELMEGLEDTSPLRPDHHLRSFSFHVSADSYSESPKKAIQENGFSSPKPLELEEDCLSNPNGDLISRTIVSDFDPQVISAFKKAFQQLSPTNPFHLRSFDHDDQQQDTIEAVKEEEINGALEMDIVEGMKITGFQEGITEGKAMNGGVGENGCRAFGASKRVVLYFTSLRGVRKTHEDCCDVRIILKGLRVRVDERDVSMHSGFKEELRELLGEGFNKGGLPRVFVGDCYIGGAEEIRRMHEESRLEKLLEGCQRMEDDGGGGNAGLGICEACGDIRFIPCETCSGSCKIYYEGEEDDEDNDAPECDLEGEYGFQRCPDCNENGLVRCPICCY
ncbi:hypothetical protein Ancab_005647 [Ancistrocladus abbreviatus]